MTNPNPTAADQRAARNMLENQPPTEYSQDRFGLPLPDNDSTYAWVVTHVNVAELGHDMADEVGTLGPRNASEAMQADLTAGEGHTFRMLDDDGVWYYRGRIVFNDQPEPVVMSAESGDERYFKPGTYLCTANLGDEEGFGPLWDFGAPNAGCTEIQYRVDVVMPHAGDNSPLSGYKTRSVWATL